MQGNTKEYPIDVLRVGGFQTVRATRKQLASVMLEHCLENRSRGSSGRPKMVFSSNGQGIALAGRSPEFAALMQEADIVHADGMPVVLASRLTNRPLPQRVATTDFFHDAAEVASREGLRFFFLGSSEKQNKAAVARVQQMYPDLQISGRHHGYFHEEETPALLRQIEDSRTDVLWVALGKPRQEQWCAEVRHLLPTVGWLKTCGGLFAFLAEDVPRAPRWMQSLGLEWLFRGLDDPTRLLWRYLTTNPYAMYRILRETDWRS